MQKCEFKGCKKDETHNIDFQHNSSGYETLPSIYVSVCQQHHDEIYLQMCKMFGKEELRAKLGGKEERK
jgi:hypothetical protein